MLAALITWSGFLISCNGMFMLNMRGWGYKVLAQVHNKTFRMGAKVLHIERFLTTTTNIIYHWYILFLRRL